MEGPGSPGAFLCSEVRYRRSVMTAGARRRALVVVGLLVLSACTAGGGGPARSTAPPTQPPGLEPVDRWTPERGPFQEPAQLFSEGGKLEVTLTADEQIVEAGGSPIRARVYNGSYIGPTLNVHPGDTLDLSLVNHLDEVTNIHFHGFHVSPSGNSDNVFLHVEPGKTQQYHVEIPDDHEPGLFWYHSHAHGVSSGQVFGGMSGLIVMEGLTDLLPEDLRGITTRQIALRDIYTEKDAPDEIPKEHDIGGTMQAPAPVPNMNSVPDPATPDTRLVNGIFRPELTIRPGETQLWRLANIGANTFYDVKQDGVTFQVIAEDGSPVWEVWEAEHLVLPPGKRFEVLVQGPPPGTYALRTLKYRQGITPANALTVFPQPLGKLVSSGDPVQPASLPDGLYPREDLSDATIVARRTFEFSIPFDSAHACTQAQGCGAQARVLFTINGKTFDADRVDVRPKLGTVEEWTLTNTSTEEHPFHIHVNDFQVMSVNGKPYEAHGLQDVVIIPIRGEVVIRNPFEDFTGKYVFHCHILNHEDGGMMAVVEVER